MNTERLFACYFSPTHTGKKIVDTICGALGKGTPTVIDLTAPSARGRDYSFAADELLVICLPVYFGRIPVIAAEALSHFSGNNTPVIATVIYGHREYEDALLELTDLLKARGFVTVAGGVFLGEHSYSRTLAAGRPDALDVEKAKSFAQRAALELADREITRFDVQVSGNRPFKPSVPKRPLFPLGDDKCVSCMACVGECPVGAISGDDPRQTDADKCINCFACVKICPTGARGIDSRPFLDKIAGLEKNCGGCRREPVFFFTK